MKLVKDTWLYPCKQVPRHEHGYINDGLTQADKQLFDAGKVIDGLYHAPSFGYKRQTALIAKIADHLNLLVTGMEQVAGEIEQFDLELMKGFANGPTEAISKIRTEDITTANTLGITKTVKVSNPGRVFSYEVLLDSISFSDLLNEHTPIEGNLFSSMMADQYQQWKQQFPDEGLDLSEYLKKLIDYGQFDHHKYQPVQDFITNILDFTIVWPMIKGIWGYDPITGEDLSNTERTLCVVMALVDIATIALSVATVGVGAPAAIAGRMMLKTAIREVVINAVATGACLLTMDLATSMGLPQWAAMLISLGVGIMIGTVGSRIAIMNSKGEVLQFIDDLPISSANDAIPSVKPKVKTGEPGVAKGVEGPPNSKPANAIPGEKPQTKTGGSGSVKGVDNPPQTKPVDGIPPIRRTVKVSDASVKPKSADIARAKDNAPVDVDGKPCDWRTGEPLREDINGKRKWYLAWDPDNNRWVAQNPGAGFTLPPSGLPAKGVKGSWGYDLDGNRLKYANYRPSYTKEQIIAVWEAAKRRTAGVLKNEDGSLFHFQEGDVVVKDISGNWYKVEWEPGQPRNWDMGHEYHSKYSELRELYMNRRISEETFVEVYQSAWHYRVEDPLRNRAHIDELISI